MILQSKSNHTSLKNHCPKVFSSAQELLCESWAEFIDKFEPFSWYLTLTFREEVHPEQADRRYMRFVRRLNEDIYGRRYREKGKGVTHVRAQEWQKRGVLHFHALMTSTLGLRRLTWMDIWNEENGFAKIERYDYSLGARWYLGKYVAKNGEIDIYLPSCRMDSLVNNGQVKMFD